MRFTFDIWLRSDFQVWPNGLGYDQQDPLLIDDFEVLLADLDYQTAYLKSEQDSGSKSDPSPPIVSFEDL